MRCCAFFVLARTLASHAMAAQLTPGEGQALGPQAARQNMFEVETRFPRNRASCAGSLGLHVIGCAMREPVSEFARARKRAS